VHRSEEIFDEGDIVRNGRGAVSGEDAAGAAVQKDTIQHVTHSLHATSPNCGRIFDAEKCDRTTNLKKRQYSSIVNLRVQVCHNAGQNLVHGPAEQRADASALHGIWQVPAQRLRNWSEQRLNADAQALVQLRDVDPHYLLAEECYEFFDTCLEHLHTLALFCHSASALLLQGH
jgi:hypothetical protein